MSNQLFNEFNPVTSKQWKQNIQFELYGADYNNTLIWKTNEDISVKPFYHSEDLKELPNPSKTKATQWKICQSIYVADVKRSNLKTIYNIKNGTESVKFIIPSETVDINDLLKNIDTASTPIHFELQFLSEAYIKQISVFTKAFVHTDIIGNLARQGNWYSNLKEDHAKFEAIVKTNKTFSIDCTLYQNAGANMVQQLAYGIAHANEYINHLKNTVIARNEMTWQSLKCIFNISVGTNYFLEIAKLRALRLLWTTLTQKYGFETDCHIFTIPTKRNKTLYDYNTNMLRTTTECMSAILGGSDTICNLPYDVLYHKGNEFGNRMARNQLLILKHESHFDKVDNPSDGAYYIESLTSQLAEKALDLFKNIEANGGFLRQLKDGTIQRKINENAQKEQQQFDANEMVLLGTNKQINSNDKMKDEIQLYPFVKNNPRKTLIQPIIEKRVSETLEQQRLKSEA